MPNQDAALPGKGDTIDVDIAGCLGCGLDGLKDLTLKVITADVDEGIWVCQHEISKFYLVVTIDENGAFMAWPCGNTQDLLHFLSQS